MFSLGAIVRRAWSCTGRRPVWCGRTVPCRSVAAALDPERLGHGEAQHPGCSANGRVACSAKALVAREDTRVTIPSREDGAFEAQLGAGADPPRAQIRMGVHADESECRRIEGASKAPSSGAADEASPAHRSPFRRGPRAAAPPAASSARRPRWKDPSRNPLGGEGRRRQSALAVPAWRSPRLRPAPGPAAPEASGRTLSIPGEVEGQRDAIPGPSPPYWRS